MKAVGPTDIMKPEGGNDARDRLWTMEGPPDMLRKLGWEFSTLFDAQKHPDVRVAAYFALNACITAVHITDWLIAALNREQRWSDAERILNADNPDAVWKAVLAFSPLATCHQVANAGKHVVLRDKSYRPGYSANADKEHLPAERDEERRALYMTTPDGEEEIVWTLYRAYEWWVKILTDFGYSIKADAPIVTLSPKFGARA